MFHRHSQLVSTVVRMQRVDGGGMMEVLLNADRRGHLEYVEPIEAGSAFDWSLVQCHSVYVLVSKPTDNENRATALVGVVPWLFPRPFFADIAKWPRPFRPLQSF